MCWYAASNVLVRVIESGGDGWQCRTSIVAHSTKHSNNGFANGGVGAEVSESQHDELWFEVEVDEVFEGGGASGGVCQTEDECWHGGPV